MDINWQELHDEAKRVMRLSYSPYSKFAVGVAGASTFGNSPL